MPLSDFEQVLALPFVEFLLISVIRTLSHCLGCLQELPHRPSPSSPVPQLARPLLPYGPFLHGSQSWKSVLSTVVYNLSCNLLPSPCSFNSIVPFVSSIRNKVPQILGGSEPSERIHSLAHRSVSRLRQRFTSMYSRVCPCLLCI